MSISTNKQATYKAQNKISFSLARNEVQIFVENWCSNICMDNDIALCLGCTL